MKSRFRIEELEAVITPDTLIDVLESLRVNGLLDAYHIDYRGGDVVLEIPKGIEINEMISGLSDLDISKRSKH